MTEIQKQEAKDWLDPDGKVTCKRPACGHRWEPMTARKPVVCPKCKSYQWEKSQPV